MQTFKIKTLFDIGTEVEDEVTKRRGTISKIWATLDKIDSLNYQVTNISYTVKPEVPTYNHFRVKEDNLREVVYDVEGNAVVMPKGMSSKD